MERKELLLLLVAVYISLASAECLNGNCTPEVEEPIPVLRISIGSFLPFFGPVDINDERNHFDDAIDPLEPITVTNSTEDKEDKESVDSSSEEKLPESVVSINIMEIVSFSNDDSKDLSRPDSDFLPLMFKEIVGMGVMDLSGMNMTGEELRSRLALRFLMARPVTTLVLSNAHIYNLTAVSLQPVQDTLRQLHADNCSFDLQALDNLSNLRFLNLSNNGLSTLRWFFKLTETLEVLDLSHNKLEEVRPELSLLTSLRELYLSHNLISSVKEFPLSMLPNLEVLSLTMNSLEDATFTQLLNLQQLDVDWNYLRLAGQDLQLPEHGISVKLASNPWRCDCGLLQTRDENDVLDIDELKCANQVSFAICGGCRRYFLPMEDGRSVSNETKDSIEHLGCTGITDQFYLLRGALEKLRENEPDKLFFLGMMVFGCLLLFVLGIISCRTSYLKKKFDRKTWLKVQQIPYLKVDQFSKPQEVPYVKI